MKILKDRATNITVNETLSRGLAKLATREAATVFESQTRMILTHTIHARKGLRRLYREKCHAIRTAFNEAIILEQSFDAGKKSETRFFCWGVASERIVMYMLTMPYRLNYTEPLALVLLEVTRHATERIFERLNTTDIKIVQTELATCAVMSVPLLFSGYVVEDPQKGIRYTTPNGTAVLNRDKGCPWSVVTWIPAKPGIPHKASEAESLMWEEVRNLLENS